MPLPFPYISVLAFRTPIIEIAFCLPVRATDSFRQVTPPSVLRSTSPGGAVSCFAARMVRGEGVAQSTEPKSQFLPLFVKLFQLVPSIVQPANPSNEKLVMRLGSF